MKAETAKKLLITISIPVWNEEGNIVKLSEALNALARRQPEYSFEFLFTDNNSEDKTFEKLKQIAEKDPRYRVIRFSRNFGFQKSILANYLEAKGDAIVQLDADLQDPTEIIDEFINYWRQGFKVIYGIRKKRQEGFLITLMRKLYYRLVSSLSEVKLPLDAGDFRLIDRVIIDELRYYKDQQPYLRGMIANLGYPQVGIPYERRSREVGESKFKFGHLIRLGIDGICSQSTRPLRVITYFGFLTSFVSIFAAFIYFIFYLVTDIPAEARGFTTLVIILLVQTGLTAAFLGIIGEYVGRVFANVRGGALVVVEKRLGDPKNVNE